MLSFICYTALLSSIVIVHAVPLPQFGNTNSGNAADNSGNSVGASDGGFESPPFWIPTRVSNVRTISENGGPSDNKIVISGGNPPNNAGDTTSGGTGVSNGGRCLFGREPQFGNGVNGMINCGNGGNNSGNGNGGSNNGDVNTNGPPVDQSGDTGGTDDTENTAPSNSGASNPPLEQTSTGPGSDTTGSDNDTDNSLNEQSGSNGDENSTENSNNQGGCFMGREPQFGNGINGTTNCGNGGDSSGGGVAGSNIGDDNTVLQPPSDASNDDQ